MIEVEVNNIPEEYKYLRTNPHLCADGETGIWRVENMTLFYESHDIFVVRCERCTSKETYKFTLNKSGS